MMTRSRKGSIIPPLTASIIINVTCTHTRARKAPAPQRSIECHVWHARRVSRQLANPRIRDGDRTRQARSRSFRNEGEEKVASRWDPAGARNRGERLGRVTRIPTVTPRDPRTRRVARAIASHLLPGPRPNRRPIGP